MKDAIHFLSGQPMDPITSPLRLRVGSNNMCCPSKFLSL